MVAIGWVIYITFIVASLRFELKGGMHRIIPTAIEKEALFGNYMVYYKASPFAKDTKENYYWIEKDRQELIAQLEEAILNTQEVAVYYDEYIGLKGFWAPPKSPITKVEKIKKGSVR